MKFDIKKVTLPVLAVLTLSVITACSSSADNQPTTVVKQSSEVTQSSSIQTVNSQMVTTAEVENSTQGGSEEVKGASILADSSLNDNSENKKSVETTVKPTKKDKKLTKESKKKDKTEAKAKKNEKTKKADKKNKNTDKKVVENKNKVEQPKKDNANGFNQGQPKKDNNVKVEQPVKKDETVNNKQKPVKKDSTKKDSTKKDNNKNKNKGGGYFKIADPNSKKQKSANTDGNITGDMSVEDLLDALDN